MMSLTGVVCELKERLTRCVETSNQKQHNVPNLHLNALYLKDYYWSAEVVPTPLFAQTDLSGSKIDLSKLTCKPAQNKEFHKIISRNHLKFSSAFSVLPETRGG
jgi:hypothetical protein